MLPDWSPRFWRVNNELKYMTVLHSIDVTPGFSFKLARRLSVVLYALQDTENELVKNCVLEDVFTHQKLFIEKQVPKI